MPGSSVYVGGGGFTEAPAAAAGQGEIRLEPGTRVVIDTPRFPVSNVGIDAKWYTTVTSRSSAAGVTTEIAELKCYIDLDGFVSSGTDAWIIGPEDAPSDLGSFDLENVGTVLAATMLCLETPAGGEPDLNLVAGNSGGQNEGTAVNTGTIIVDRGGRLGRRGSQTHHHRQY